MNISIYYLFFGMFFLTTLLPHFSFGVEKIEKEVILVIARHGETAWNKQKIAHGCTDIPLNIEGTEQAKQLGDRFKEYRFLKCYSSDLSRAKETAVHALGDRSLLRFKKTSVFVNATSESTKENLTKRFGRILKQY